MHQRHSSLSRERLAELFRQAEKAHTEYEKGLGRRDEEWPEWYAEFIVEKLAREE